MNFYKLPFFVSVFNVYVLCNIKVRQAILLQKQTFVDLSINGEYFTLVSLLIRESRKAIFKAILTNNSIMFQDAKELRDHNSLIFAIDDLLLLNYNEMLLKHLFNPKKNVVSLEFFLRNFWETSFWVKLADFIEFLWFSEFKWIARLNFLNESLTLLLWFYKPTTD